MAGNYGHLGLVTSVACFSLVPSSLLPTLLFSLPLPPLPSLLPLFQSFTAPSFFSLLSSLLPLSLTSFFDSLVSSISPWIGGILGVCCLFQFFLSLPPLFSLWKGHLVLPRVLIYLYKCFEPYQIANPYGVFGSLQDYRFSLFHFIWVIFCLF